MEFVLELLTFGHEDALKTFDKTVSLILLIFFTQLLLGGKERWQ